MCQMLHILVCIDVLVRVRIQAHSVHTLIPVSEALLRMILGYLHVHVPGVCPLENAVVEE